MSSNHTHYDNLKVSPKAPAEVIRAAYKALMQQWHPDKHPEDKEHALKVCQIIQSSYGVLSDPVKKEAYDSKIKGTLKSSEGLSDMPTEALAKQIRLYKLELVSLQIENDNLRRKVRVREDELVRTQTSFMIWGSVALLIAALTGYALNAFMTI